MTTTATRLPIFLLIFLLFCSFSIARAEDNQAVIATYAGGEVTVSDVYASYTNELNAILGSMNYIAQMQGQASYTPSDEDLLYVKEYVTEAYLQQRVIFDKLIEMGLSDLTEEEKAALQANAEYTFMQYAYPYCLQYGWSYDEAAYLLNSQGVSISALYDQAYYSQIYSRVMNALEVSEEVTEEEIAEKYAALVEKAEKTYAAGGATLENAANSGSVIYFMPEGAKYIKHIILIPEDEDLMNRYKEAYTDLTAYESELATITSPTYEPKYEAYIEKAILDECKENIALTEELIETLKLEVLSAVNDDLNKIQADLNEGESFDALIEAYSDDPGSFQEPVKTKGYLVHEKSAGWDEAFKAAADELENVGDVSEPAIGSLGVYIVKYESDAAPGAAALEDVKDAVVSAIITDRKTEEFNTLAQKWYEEANVSLSLQAWK